MNNEEIIHFQQQLLMWYKEEKRDLPWRQTSDPYKIWVSEVMLQQTRVDTVIPYYHRFLETFPTMQHLAEAEEDTLLKQWEGLGYYSRARNLQAGVREVVEQYNGEFPKTRSEVLGLKGVGPYTAGAVLSIAYGIPEHAVDGNVMRVLSRILLIEEDIAKPKTRKVFEQAVMNIISKEDPSSFNQALMELGATICTPTSPKCLLCPVRDFCGAFHEGKTDTLPIKSKAKKARAILYDVLLIRNEQNEWLMEKRASEGLLAGLWQFPMVEFQKNEDPITKFEQHSGISIYKEYELGAFKHVFSHLVWNMDAIICKVEHQTSLPESFQWIKQEDIRNYPMPVSMQKIWAAWIDGGQFDESK